MWKEKTRRQKWTKPEDKLLMEIMKGKETDTDWKAIQEEMAMRGVEKSLKQLKVR